MMSSIYTTADFGRQKEKIRQKPITAILLCMSVIFILLFAVSCKQKTGPQQKTAKSDTGIHKTYERGPVVCNVDTDKSEMTIAQRLTLTITVVSDPNYEVELPKTGEKLSEFGIVDYHTASPELTKDGKTKVSQSYILEPFLSGDYTIPAMTVHFWKAGEKGKDDHSLETEKISIKVKSLLPQDLKKMKLHGIMPPVGLPVSIAVWIWVAGIFGGAVIIGLLVFFIVLRRRNAISADAEIYLPPHERAYMELERLVAENLIEKGEIKIFYQEISNILRRYIENRFGINAPDQTTEEFLTGLKSDTTFPTKYHALLKDFLTHCDLVKFATLQPSTEEIQNTFNSCKTFIEETKVEEKE